MAPEELDKVLSKFYAEVKKKDGDDYEPESLKIMQSAIERYLKEKNYPLSIVRSREFHSSQEILNAKAISLRQQGKGKRPNKAQPITPEEESALWEKGQLGDFARLFDFEFTHMISAQIALHSVQLPLLIEPKFLYFLFHLQRGTQD